MNLDDQIHPESHCPLNRLSPRHLQMRYENLQEETNKLKQKCIRFQEKLEVLSNKDTEEIAQDEDPNAYDLITKMLMYINDNPENAYKEILTEVMKNMCMSKKKKNEILSDDENEECKTMATALLQQIQANINKIAKKEKGVRFSPKILRVALSLYTRSKVGYEELQNSSIEVMPSASTLAHIKSKMKTCDGTFPKMYQWFYDDTICHIPDAYHTGHIMCNEMHLKSGIYWNTASKKIDGFASDSQKLDLATKLCYVNDAIDGKREYSTMSSTSDRSPLADNAAAEK